MISPDTLERNSDGAMRYVTSLKGPLDGCRLEILYLPKGEMTTRLIDGNSGDEIEAMKLLIGTREDSSGEKTKLMRITRPQQAGIQLVWDGVSQTLQERQVDDLQDQLLKLSVWWLSQSFDCPVSTDDLTTFSQHDDRLSDLADELVTGREMEAFYGGRELVLHTGMSLQTYFDPSPKDGWILEMGMHDGEDYLGWIDGSVLIMDNEEIRFTIGGWTNKWDKDDLKNDMLALALRFLRVRVGAISTMHLEGKVDMEMAEINRRSRFWLEF